MPLELIGAGFGRTGTVSVQAALDILFEDESKRCYHFGTIAGRPGDARLWMGVLAGEVDPAAVDWEADVFGPGRFVATLDHPCAEYYEHLIKAYPEANVILTSHPRGREGWYRSKLGHQLLLDSLGRWPLKPLSRIATWFFIRSITPNHARKKTDTTNSLSIRDLRRLVELTENNVWGEEGVHNKVNAIGRYDRWYARVRKIVPKEKLLEYDVSMGWEPLCALLGKPIPDAPFPAETNHSTKEVKKLVAKAEMLAWSFYGVLGAGTMLLAMKVVTPNNHR